VLNAPEQQRTVQCSNRLLNHFHSTFIDFHTSSAMEWLREGWDGMVGELRSMNTRQLLSQGINLGA
jgi:hypothetical protein